MVLLAFSPQHEVEKYGAYVAVACFFGLAILSLLYFAQARELRRLRDWAGVQPERPEELEARVNALVDSVRRVSNQQAAAVRQAAPQPAVATNGAHKLKPEQVAALAFARAAGVPKPPHPPQPGPVPVPQPVAVAAAPAAPEAPATAVEEPVTDAGNGNGRGHGEVPPPVTPAGRAAPLRQTPPPRRPAPAPAPARRMPTGPPARRETSTRSIVLTVALGVVVLAAVAFAGVKLLGGGSSTPKAAGTKNANPLVTPNPGTSTGGSGTKKAKPTPTPTRATISVEVFNGTLSGGLAAEMKDRLVNAGYTSDNIGADNDPQTRQRAGSAVLYKRGAVAQARDVAKVLAITAVKPIDAATQQLAPTKSIVVEVGADKSGD